MDQKELSEARQVELADKLFKDAYNAARETKVAGISPFAIGYCLNAMGAAIARGGIDLDRTYEEHIEYRKSQGEQL